MGVRIHIFSLYGLCYFYLVVKAVKPGLLLALQETWSTLSASRKLVYS